ncbi:hypothetical protein [Fulvivirga lutea]|uniref:Uncharacterized protein n=1 Tax=Fulvivirga lutea TaxID=2810512 RepID=A0A974ZZT2_9BACT|nr:hypothetical protein [Fulvivirga lutea]QSE96460.1 hypothetical protein JR347_12720 [Fulvivirga lutea]
MDQFEYVVVLTSLILGLGIAQILTGIADVISNFRNTKLYLPHTLFVIFIFLLHIQDWWINYEYANVVESWTLKVVLLLLAYPIALFIMARMIFPTGLRSAETDFKQYYIDQWRYLFIIGSSTVVLSILHNSIISEMPLSMQLPQFAYLLTYIVFIVSKTNNHWAHLAFQSITFLGIVIYILTDMRMLDSYMP